MVLGVGTFRAVYLVSADGHQVDVVFDDVDGYLPDRLGAVGMEEHASGSTHAACRQHPNISIALHAPSVLHPDFSPALYTVKSQR